jgi:hypothetical protein
LAECLPVVLEYPTFLRVVQGSAPVDTTAVAGRLGRPYRVTPATFDGREGQVLVMVLVAVVFVVLAAFLAFAGVVLAVIVARDRRLSADRRPFPAENNRDRED